MMQHDKGLTQRILISLSWIRAAALLMQVVYLLWFVRPIQLFVWVLLVVQLCLLLSGWLNQKIRLSDKAVMVNLSLDLVLLAGYVYLTGGVSNPMISLLLLPVVTASVAVNRVLAFVVLLLASALYTVMFLNSSTHHHGDTSFSSHLMGMWLVFIASGALLFYVVSYLSAAIREQQKRIQRHEQRQLRDDYLTALGLSAADAAHQLNTPLATLSVLIDDLSSNDESQEGIMDDDVLLMQRQIQRCVEITQSIQCQFNELKAGDFIVISVAQLIKQVRGGFRLLHPEISLQVNGDKTLGFVRSHVGLNSALLNLLDNAVKASQGKDATLVLSAAIESDHCIIEVTDQGAGLEQDFIENYGWQPAGSKNGMGVGSLISNASIEHVGGRLSIKNNAQGATARVELPLVSIGLSKQKAGYSADHSEGSRS